MSRLAKYAHSAELLVDRLRPKSGNGDLIVEPYIGYSTSNGVIVRGRVLEEPTLDLLDHILDFAGPVGAMLTNFMTDEVAGVEVCAAGEAHSTDEEGYFSIEVPKSSVFGDHVSITLSKTGDEFEMPVSQTHPNSQHGIISDIDDTILETGAWEITRNLWTTFTTASNDRVIFDDTVALIRDRQSDKNPLFFVSSSPWNLHQYLLEIFKRTDAPIGPMFLRDLGVDETKFIKSTHGSHKGDAIDTILAANPYLTFTLIGDTGQHDGQVYLDAIGRHPKQIIEVCLRNAGDQDVHDQDVAERIEATGIKFYSGPNFAPLLRHN